MLAAVALFAVALAGASTPGADVRLTNDCHPDVSPPSTAATATCGVGYVSAYTLATGNAYTDQTLNECTVSRGRENEPAVAMDPRDDERPARQLERLLRRLQPRGACGRRRADLARVLPLDGSGRELHELARPGVPGRHVTVRGALTGSYCICRRPGRSPGTTTGAHSSARRAPTIRPARRRRLATSSSPASRTRTAPMPRTRPRTAWPTAGRPWSHSGSSAPNLLGKFNDKTAIEADRTGSTL